MTVYNVFVNKNLSTQGLPAGSFIYGGNFNNHINGASNPFKLTGSSIFQPATKEDLLKVDYKKILSNANDGDNLQLSPLENSLKEFFALDKIKVLADKNGDGQVSEAEAQAYVNELVQKDGNGETLSLADFEKVINEQGIDLEAISKFLNSVGIEIGTSQPEVAQVAPMQTQSQAGTIARRSYAPKSSNYSSAPAGPKSINNMSLEELKTEKANRESTLSEKEKNLKAVQSGNTESIKSAKEQMEQAKKSYEDALKNDSKTAKFAKNIINNNKQIEKNQLQLDKNALKITEKQSEISQQKSSISSAETMLSSLEGALSKLPSVTGKPEDKAKDKQIEAKRNQLNKEISAKKKEIQKLKSQLEKLNSNLAELQEEKTQLEKEKSDLQTKKLQLDEVINKTASEAVKSKLEAYNKALKNVDAVKAKELEAANSAYSSAQKQVQEINAVISQKEANAEASKYSVSSDKIDKALELAESQIGVRENGGSNDSAEIRKYKNGSVDGNPWCASFSSWLYGAGQGSSNSKTFGYTASSQEIKRKATSAGCYASKNSNYVPQKGDLAMWSKSASSGHVGIVSKVYADGSFDVIEGNSGNAVKKHHYSSKHSVGGGFDGFVQMDKWLQA